MRAGRIGCQFPGPGPPASLSSGVSFMRATRSFLIAILLCGLGSPIFAGDFYQQYLSAVDTNKYTQPLGALPGLVATNNTGIKVTNAVVDLNSLKQSGEISRVRLGMTMQEVVDRWGKPKGGWSRCLHGLITFSYTGVSLGFEGNRLETIHFSPPAKLAGGLSPKSTTGEFVRVLGAPTSQVGSCRPWQFGLPLGRRKSTLGVLGPGVGDHLRGAHPEPSRAVEGDCGS